MPKVSVIMPVYNTCNKEILSKSINSILSQSYPNIELIICDDYSNDGTYELLKSLINKEQNVILLRNEKNMGVSKTRNRCIEVSTGEYIALQDCDDWSDEFRIEKQVAFLRENLQYSFVSSKVFYYENGKLGTDKYYVQYPEKQDFLYSLPFCHSATTFRKTDILSVNGYRVSKETTFRAEDYDLFMRMYANGLKGAVLPERLYYYRLNINAKRKKNYKYCIHEAIVRFKRFKDLQLLPKGMFYVIKPLLAGLIPAWIMRKYHFYFFKDF